MSAQGTHTFVIVGGNFGGVDISHMLLRRTIPALQKSSPSKTFRVVLVTPNSHFYFKIAGPRALINSELIPEEKYFKSIADGFSQYGSSAFSHVQGKAISLDPKGRSIQVQLSLESKQETVKYDSLVIATGTTSSSPLWTVHDSHETTRAALKALHEALPKASTVLIAGAGPVGVETAGEVASAYPNAKVTILSASAALLPKQTPGLSQRAEQALKDLGVTIKLNARLKNKDQTSIRGPIELSDGSSENPDVFINATGATKMNTEWLPDSWLNEEKRVLTKDSYFRVKGDGATEGVYVLGDLVPETNNTAIELDAMIPTVASSIAVDVFTALNGGAAPENGGLLSWLNPFGSAAPSQVEYKPMNGTIVIPIGPNGGVGTLFGWNAPSFMVKKGKAEKFLVELVDPVITGKKRA